MSGKVIHIDADTHRIAKLFCEKNELRMSNWVADLIIEAIVNNKTFVKSVGPITRPVPVPMREPELAPPEKPQEDPWIKDPFWAQK
jgi:hypothetical protein